MFEVDHRQAVGTHGSGGLRFPDDSGDFDVIERGKGAVEGELGKFPDNFTSSTANSMGPFTSKLFTEIFGN